MKKIVLLSLLCSMNLAAFESLQKPFKEKEDEEDVVVIDGDLKKFIDEQKCQVVAIDFKTGKISCYSCQTNHSYSDILDVAYPYFEQMKKRSSCPQGSWVELDDSKLVKGCVFFNQKGIIDVETAKKFNQSQNGESLK
jgi:hypothetical protein